LELVVSDFHAILDFNGNMLFEFQIDLTNYFAKDFIGS